MGGILAFVGVLALVACIMALQETPKYYKDWWEPEED